MPAARSATLGAHNHVELTAIGYARRSARSDPLIGDDDQASSSAAMLGYNRQFDHWVVGLEGSVDGTNLVKTSTLAVTAPAASSMSAR